MPSPVTAHCLPGFLDAKQLRLDVDEWLVHGDPLPKRGRARLYRQTRSVNKAMFYLTCIRAAGLDPRRPYF